MKTEKTRHCATAKSRIIAKLGAVKNKRYNIGSYSTYKSFSFDNGDNGNCRNDEFLAKKIYCWKYRIRYMALLNFKFCHILGLQYGRGFQFFLKWMKVWKTVTWFLLICMWVYRNLSALLTNLISWHSRYSCNASHCYVLGRSLNAS